MALELSPDFWVWSSGWWDCILVPCPALWGTRCPRHSILRGFSSFCRLAMGTYGLQAGSGNLLLGPSTNWLLVEVPTSLQSSIQALPALEEASHPLRLPATASLCGWHSLQLSGSAWELPWPPSFPSPQPVVPSLMSPACLPLARSPSGHLSGHSLITVTLSKLSKHFLLLGLLCSFDFPQSVLSEQRSLLERQWSKFRGKLKLGVSNEKVFLWEENDQWELQGQANFPQKVTQPTVCVLDTGTCPSHPFSPRRSGVSETWCAGVYTVGSVVSPTSSSNGNVHVFTQTHVCFKITNIREGMSYQHT